MRKKCILCGKKLKPIRERFCKNCVETRSMESRYRVFRDDWVKNNKAVNQSKRFTTR
jgi:hypothetical protein